MAAYKNPKSSLVQSKADLSATMLQRELFDFGVELKGPETHYDLTSYIQKHGADAVRAVAMKALDRYTEDGDGSQGKTAEEYIMERLKIHHWDRNGHNGHSA
ncbi:MAG: hypothetical protein HYT72_00195 [Candidatus Aenigmarchaeota archaeon]|nr:hypothetical protein [Candidatus Aenigmarchaeota archaeon]